MVNGHEYDRFREVVGPALESKMSEFQILGYQKVNEQEIWNYLTNKKWKKCKEDIHLYEIVEDIFSVKVGQYMNYATVETYKSPEFSFDNEDDLKALLK
jgi:hypothetical protein